MKNGHNGHNGHNGQGGHGPDGRDGISVKSTGVRPLRARGVREAFAGKHLFVTGVTGFLGKVWLGMLLDHVEEVGRVTVVIRPKKGEDARARFERIVERNPAFRPLRAKHGAGLRALVAKKVNVVEARLTAPLCGFSCEEARALMSDVDAVVHFAGLTDFEPDPQQALDANVHGARHAADLAALTPSKRYVHVSTTYVAGMRSGPVEESLVRGVSPTGVRFDPEEELATIERELAACETKKQRLDLAMARARALGWPNVYTYSKALSEHLLEDRRDIHTTTFRPAIVECARSYPFPGWNEGINTSGPLVWLLSTAFQRLPAKKTLTFDIVPVDTVARSMMVTVAAALRDEAEPIYQCASGDLNPLHFERAADLTSIALRRLTQKREDASWWEKNVVARLDTQCLDYIDDEQILGYRRLREAARATRNFLKDFELARVVPAALYEKVDGEKLEAELRSFSMKCRTTDRRLGTVDEMLRQFRPFIWDHDYTFRTANLQRASERLDDEERALFGFDVPEICWRRYWVEVQVPGLDTWCLPVLRGEKVHEDPPMAVELAEPASAEVPSADGFRTKKSDLPADPRRMRATA
ncbi:MAG: SDR family oxidoreductase [Myxococcales bacterium]|nr:SDR family oxidoreductase [Myxococcales bacterium]